MTDIRTTLKVAVAEVLAELGVLDAVFSVEHPTELSHGDYATNAALAAAKTLGANPRELAESIAAHLRARKIPQVAAIDIAGPGFINIHLSRDFFANAVARATAEGERWGWNGALAGEQVLIEYTSPNLFKPLHIGNLVGNIIGESLTRLAEASGADVKRLNYPSDIGLTVAKGVWGLRETGGNPDDITALGEAYRFGNDAYEAGGEAKEAIEAVNRALYAGTDAVLSELRSRGIATSRARLTELCRMLGTTFDAEIFESEAGPIGTRIVREHLADRIFEESEGAVIFTGERHGLHTRVFLNAQGLPTYEAKDLGNFMLKQERYPHWTQSIVVTGREQLEYFRVIIAAIREVFVEARDRVVEHVPTGFLTLTTGKMSSRKGNVLTGESLITEVSERAAARIAAGRTDNAPLLVEQVAIAAIKYQILRSGVGTDIVFDKERALSFEGDSGPYLQYTYARTRSILEKATREGVSSSVAHPAPSVPVVEQLLYRFPEEVERALAERAPHYVATYLIELAGAFNAWYAAEKIVDVADEYSPYRVVLTEAVGQTLKNGLWCLGIAAPERM